MKRASTERINKPANDQLFDNKLLEYLTHTHAYVPISIFLVGSIGMIFYGVYENLISPISCLAAFISGWLLFTWVEYAAHRFVYHMPETTQFRKDLTYKFHGVHHDFPKDKSRLAMPPIVSTVLASLLFVMFTFLMGNWTYGFLPGFLTGYATYLLIHYIVHSYRPPKNFLRVLWVHHGIHHYKDPERAFGVSSTLWDHIYGTMPIQKK
ncbi:sterol desaturase family protein [Sediminitomix flava]|uniref:Fatty acid hydroxylase family protein n=1 Tax=Sediminitomix flava TaxID=379075 RepID=A0A315ZGA7_SEDFL|nr:sterol desaturase family protein [Sediminitomix flava]PWJ44362.1 fatty acid hydroxylase family protein [Sediminitomix flava]